MIDYQQALSVAKNYANNLPKSSNIARAHITGLCSVLERAGAERDALAKRLNDEGVSHDNTMIQRDYAEEMADKLSLAIVGITGRDVGEHSSANCPWRNAVEFAEEYESERDELTPGVVATTGGTVFSQDDPDDWKVEAKSVLAETPEASFSQLKAERDALAAHLERIITEWNSGDDLFSDEWINRVGDIVEDAPETSLARRDLLKQAEVLGEAGRYIRCEEDAALLRINAQELRRQAEGGEV